MAMVLITHDIGVVAGSADRVAVMYAGRLAEAGTVEEVLTAPQHPYTKALLAAIPRPSDAVGAPFRGLSGMPPMLGGPMRSCAFAPRCSEAFDICEKKRPAMRPVGDGSVFAACHALSAVRKEVA